MILRRILTNQYLQIWLFGLTTLLFILAGMYSDRQIIALIPFAVMAGLLLVVKPSMVLLLFIASFYLGDPLLYRGMILVDGADLSLILLAAAALSVLFSTSRLSISISPTDRTIMVLLGLMISISLLSVVLNLPSRKISDITTSFWYLFNLGQLVAVYLIFSRDSVCGKREAFVTTILMLSAIETMLATGQFLHSGQADVNTLREVKGTFVLHHSMLGNMMVIPLALCIYRYMKAGTVLLRTGYFAGIILSLFTIVISGSRSTLFGIFAAGSVWLLTTFKISRRYFATLVIILAVIGAIGMLTPLKTLVVNTFKNQSTQTLDLSSYGRILIWRGAVINFIEAPPMQKIFGIGIGNYNTMKYSFRLVEGSKNATGAHNNFLHVLTETGITGFLVFAALFAAILVNLRRRSKNDRLCHVYFYVTIALLFSGVTQETFWFQPAFSRFWLFHMVVLALCLGNTKYGTAEPGVQPQPTLPHLPDADDTSAGIR